jgi:hypothetical protein
VVGLGVGQPLALVVGMNISDLFRRASTAISQTVSRSIQNLATDVTVPAKVNVLRGQVVNLEAKLYRLERTSDSFMTRTGQRVESREVSQLRRELVSKKAELGDYESILKTRAEEVQNRRLQVLRNMR